MTADRPSTVELLSGLSGLDAEAGLRRLREATAPTTLVELAEAAEQLAIDDLGRAVELTALLVEMADRDGAAAPRVRTRRARAQALAYASQFEAALAVLDEAAAVADDDVEDARIRMTRLHALAKLGRYDDAVREGEAARAAFLAGARPDLAARADINLGVTHRMQDNPRRALEHFDRARPLLAAEPLIVAQLDSNRAEALLDLCRFREAEQAFRGALSVFDAARMTRAAAIVEGNLGDLMSRQGRIAESLDHLERARRCLEDQQSPGEAARVEAEQAEAFAGGGLLDEALESYRHAIPRLEAHGLAWDAARARTGLGRTLMDLGAYAEAALALDEAAERFAALEHETGLARVRLLQGLLAMCTARDAEARRWLLEALPSVTPADAVRARVSLAVLDMRTDALDDALARLDEGLAVAETLSLVPQRVDLLQTRGQLWRLRGRRVEALADLRRAADDVERIRGRLRSERHRRAFFGRQIDVYEDLISTLLEIDDEAGRVEAFAVAERARSRSLLDRLDGGVELVDEMRRRASDAAESELLAEVVERQGELTALYGRFDALPAPDATPLEAPPPGEVEQFERRLQVLESRLASTLGAGELFAPPADLATIQSLLPPGIALLEYFRCGDDLAAFVVRGDGFEHVPRLARLEALEERLDRFHFQVSRAIARVATGGVTDDRMVDDTRHELEVLHDMLMAPLGATIAGARHLVVVPHGPLHALPFHALHDGRRYLIESREVSYAPSASLLRPGAAAEYDGAPTKGTLVAGVADVGTPHIGREVQLVSALCPGATVLRDGEATMERVASSVAGRRVLHLACHGRFTPAAPLASGLRLADGWLTIRDIYDLRAGGATVVLSGCETGGAAVDTGEELVGMVRAFFAAGASTLVMSLWTVSDESTAELMATFYKSWHNGTGPSPSAALRVAQRVALRQRPHPAFWAPFVAAARHLPEIQEEK